MSVIVSCDPGGIKPGTNSGTGYAVLDTEDMSILHMEIANHNPEECVRAMRRWRSGYSMEESAHVLAEGFIPRWGQPFSLDSVYLIGGLQGYFGADLALVNPSVHIGVVPKPKLTALMKAQGYAIQAGHSRMALSVAVYYAGFVLRKPKVLEFLADNN